MLRLLYFLIEHCTLFGKNQIIYKLHGLELYLVSNVCYLKLIQISMGVYTVLLVYGRYDCHALPKFISHIGHLFIS